MQEWQTEKRWFLQKCEKSHSFRCGNKAAGILGKFDAAYPEEVVRKGDEYALYDDMEQIAYNPNGGKVVINLCTDDLKKEYHRIKTLGIRTDLTDIRYINAGMPYWYFCLKDLDGNTIERMC